MPFLRLLIPFILGILLSYHGILGIRGISWMALLGLLLFCFQYLLSLQQLFRWAWLSGLGIYCLLLAMGAFNEYWHQPKQVPHALATAFPISSHTCVEMLEAPVPNSKHLAGFGQDPCSGKSRNMETR